ncbi:MAG: type II toxin-antitoxin system PrlF family antitoxin [Xenococcaceae cyanobacterium MO_188.B32]|nr:type II toxin-antitoxin system PrlF family antitoxin [Xenococcaceae cyanobacterium MO_188.B32]
MLQAESTLTDRYQTTVPEVVRKALGLSKRDKICYIIHTDGTVTIDRSEESEDDPILSKFLSFLAQDMEKNPQYLQPISRETLQRVRSLVGDVDIDLDAPLSDEDE